MQSRPRSLRRRIAVGYVLLTIFNVLLLSTLVFENQLELLQRGAVTEAKNLGNDLSGRVETQEFPADPAAAEWKNLETVTAGSRIIVMLAFSPNGRVIFQKPAAGAPESVPVDLLRRTVELQPGNSVFRSRFLMNIAAEDFTVEYLFPIRMRSGGTAEPAFLQIRLELGSAPAQLRQLFIQAGIVALVIGLGHIVFGWVVVRLFFVRVGLLADASERLRDGDLQSRADWQTKSPDELDLLGSTFNEMAGKIEEKITTISRLNQVIQEELKFGRDVQTCLLPDLSRIESWKVYSYYKPLREVSGDVYHFAELSGKPFFLFGDASGHGVSAALVTSVALLSLEEILKRAATLEEAADMLNAEIAGRMKNAFFFLCAVFILRDKGHIHFINAGVPAPIFISRDGKRTEFLRASSPPIGLATETFRHSSIRAEPGDRILFYSDGITEGQNASGKPIGQFGLARFARRMAGLSSGDLLNAVGSMYDETVPEQTDDATAMVLELK